MPSLSRKSARDGSCYDGEQAVNVNAGRLTGPFISGVL
jgi:hypothetical protein